MQYTYFSFSHYELYMLLFLTTLLKIIIIQNMYWLITILSIKYSIWNYQPNIIQLKIDTILLKAKGHLVYNNFIDMHNPQSKKKIIGYYNSSLMKLLKQRQFYVRTLQTCITYKHMPFPRCAIHAEERFLECFCNKVLQLHKESFK